MDHRYRLPSPAAISCEALPLLHGAMGEQVLRDAVGRGQLRPPHCFRGSPGHRPLWGDAAGWPAGGVRQPEEAGHAWVRHLPLDRAAEMGRGSCRGRSASVAWPQLCAWASWCRAAARVWSRL